MTLAVGRIPDDYNGLTTLSMFGPILRSVRRADHEAAQRLRTSVKTWCSHCGYERPLEGLNTEKRARDEHRASAVTAREQANPAGVHRASLPGDACEPLRRTSRRGYSVGLVNGVETIPGRRDRQDRLVIEAQHEGVRAILADHGGLDRASGQPPNGAGVERVGYP